MISRITVRTSYFIQVERVAVFFSMCRSSSVGSLVRAPGVRGDQGNLLRTAT